MSARRALPGRFQRGLGADIVGFECRRRRALAIIEACDAAGLTEATIAVDLIQDVSFRLADTPAERVAQVEAYIAARADAELLRENHARLADALIAAGAPELISPLFRAGYILPPGGIAREGKA